MTGWYRSLTSWWVRSMKPERLEMVGFAPFRAPVDIDFTGLDLFALTGPTGAGKSSVIDAITFTLYGVVARYDDKRSVEPIISLGAAEARLRFQFEVSGTSYTAVRVVRRTAKGGATTAEARLETDERVLASGAAEVTREIEGLLGLNIDHFTRSVVLPQGEFAAFLHDTPSGQQDLVKALLDMGALDDVRRLASERAKTAMALAGSAQGRLDHLVDATEEAESAANKRLGHLESLTGVVTELEEAVLALQASLQTEAAELTAVAEKRSIVDRVRVPDSIGDLSDTLTEARLCVDEASSALQKLVAEMDKVRAESDQVPSAERLARLEKLHRQIGEARRDLGGIALEDLATAVSASKEKVAAAVGDMEVAADALDAAKARHAAHALTSGLDRGDPCPVCGQALPAKPDEAPPDLHKAQIAKNEADERLEAARAGLRSAEAAMAQGKANSEAIRKSITEMEAEIAGEADPAELSRLLKTRQKLDERIVRVRDELAKARQADDEARRRVVGLQDAEARAWASFTSCRDGLASIGRPPGPVQDLARSWEDLSAWCQQQSGELRAAQDALSTRLDRARQELEEHKRSIQELLAGAAVEGSGNPTARLAAAVATAASDVERIRERRQERESLEKDLKSFEERSEVARTLGNHLRADRFQGWLMAEALATLVEGANTLLGDLSQGSYSLAVTDRQMAVIDHRNAEERRSVRSLSGGETFLVSLALALSLGEQLTNLTGGTQLDAIFLDEGFGSLDAETLETVAVVVTELSARGRVVGLVTHVKELAEQVPVRFEVKPGPGGSTVERISR